MEYGIRFDWEDVNDEKTKPDWMRQKPPKPCDCKICFFCKEGITNGIYHMRGGKRTRGEKKKNTTSPKKTKEDELLNKTRKI